MAHKKVLFSKDDYFKQLDEMLAPGQMAQPGSLLTRLRQAAQKGKKLVSPKARAK